MQYNSLESHPLPLSAVSLGTEYLLRASEAETRETVERAIEGGVSYFDLFYAQPEFQERMGAIIEPHRDKVMLAAHFGAGEKNGQYERTRDPDRCEAYFAAFLENYRTSYVDVLFCHNCDELEDLESMLAPGGLCDRIRGHRDGGRVRLVGFSGHTAATAARAVESGRFDLLMFPVNVTNHGDPAVRNLYALCERKGVPIVAMKPYAGGKLVGQNADASHNHRAAKTRAGAEGLRAVRCIAYALSRPAVLTVVPGCSNPLHVDDALRFLVAGPEGRDFSQLLSEHAGTARGECTYCNHCLPCPAGIDIGAALRDYDTYRDRLGGAPAEVAGCTLCGSCTRRCPFGVDVVPRMREMMEALTG